MKLTSGQIRGLLKKREDERVEFKRAASALPANFWDSYSAFCNTDGGVIILGVAEGNDGRFSIEGVKNAQKLIADFWSTANNAEKVSYSIFFGHYVYPVKCGKKTVDQRHLIECIVCDATRVQYDLNIVENLVDIMFRIISCWHSWLLFVRYWLVYVI